MSSVLPVEKQVGSDRDSPGTIIRSNPTSLAFSLYKEEEETVDKVTNGVSSLEEYLRAKSSGVGSGIPHLFF